MLAIQNLSIQAGVKPLLESASLALHPGQKIGLVGQNGAGKTTLFRAILGEVSIESGQIAIPANWVLSHVEQEVKHSGANVLDFVCAGDTQYDALIQRIHAAEKVEDHEVLVQAHDEMDQLSGYLVPQQARQLLAGLGFQSADFERSVSEFSGGWQVRLNLARALMQRSDLLLLDEPTNHLDIEAVAWLIQWLKSYSGAVLLISHDRDFLDQVVQGIAHIHHHKITYYAGNFAAFERQRNERLMQQQQLHDKQKQQMQHLKSFIERFKAKASKAKQAQSRVKALERMELVAAVQASNPFQFKFFEPKHQPDPMVGFAEVSFAYDENPIVQQACLTLRAQDRIGLVGVNGSGKSTLLKLLVGDLMPQSGKVVLSKGVAVGYFAQHQLQALTLEHSPVQHMLQLSDEVTDQQARDFLGQFGFSHEQALHPVDSFSGGEKARLALAMIVYQKPNLIILDEPTNHLDMETRDALDMALQDFSGALILVTHDKHLLASIADQFWWIHDSKVERYHGDLDSYLQERLKRLKESAVAEKIKLQPEEQVKTKKQQRQQNAFQRKQLDQLLKSDRQRIKKLEKQMESLQAELDALHAKMENPDFYEQTDKSELTATLKKQAEVEEQLADTEMEWLDCEEQIEQTSQQFWEEHSG